MSAPSKEIEMQRNFLLRCYPNEIEAINKDMNQTIELFDRERKAKKHYKANEK
jgi:hypothetical protein